MLLTIRHHRLEAYATDHFNLLIYKLKIGEIIMLEVGWYSTKLLLKGKLLRNPFYFIKQVALATAVGALILIIMAQIETTLLLPIIFSSLATGIAMPFLLKDVKLQ